MTKPAGGRQAKFVLGMLVSAVFVFWAARGLKWGAVVVTLKDGYYGWLVPALAAYFVAVLLRSWRWQLLLNPLKRVPFRDLFPVVVIGYMGNNVLPARAGELLRCYTLKKTDDVSISSALATIVLERVFDAMIMLCFVLATISLFAASAKNLWITVGLGLFCVMVLASFGLVAAKPAFLCRLYDWAIGHLIPNRFQEVTHRLAKSFLGGLQSLRSIGAIAGILVISLALWLSEAATYSLVARVFPELRVTFPQLVFMLAITNLFTTLPSTPGYIGTFDAPGIAVLTRFGAARYLAASFTLVLHLVLWLPITLLGWAFMVAKSVKWSEASASRPPEVAPDLKPADSYTGAAQ